MTFVCFQLHLVSTMPSWIIDTYSTAEKRKLVFFFFSITEPCRILSEAAFLIKSGLYNVLDLRNLSYGPHWLFGPQKNSFHYWRAQGCQKITFFFLQMKLLSFCAKIASKRHKLQKPSKLKKKCQKNPVFLDFFEYSSNWGQS